MPDPLISTSSRREARRLSRRETILDVAAQSFLEQGYDGTTMSGVAATLGGSKGTLWSYFSSKELLFAAVIDRVTEAFRAQLTQILNPHDPVETALHRFCEGFLGKVTSPQALALHRLVVGEVSRFPEIGRIFYERGPRMTHCLLADYIERAMDRGLLRRADPSRAARQLISLCMAGSHQRLLVRVDDAVDAETIRADIDAATQTFLAAYAP